MLKVLGLILVHIADTACHQYFILVGIYAEPNEFFVGNGVACFIELNHCVNFVVPCISALLDSSKVDGN